MSTSTCSVYVPSGVRGMKILDREKFIQDITLPVLKVPGQNISKIMALCKSYFLKLEYFKPVQMLINNPNDNVNKCIYFDPEKVTSWESIPESIRSNLKILDIDENNFGFRDVQLTYNNYKYETIFKAVLPESEENLTSFSQIGHIIHLNLKQHLLEYRSLIGQVLVDKIKTCRTVVNKNSVIDNTFRNFAMEVIAGDKDFLVTVKENKCIFQLDFSKVYWNPRLCKEHERILQSINPGDVLFDLFAGVGPFAVPAGKKNCRVFANDLNPESYKWLIHNAKFNKIKPNLFRTFNMDAKDFITKIFKCFIVNYCNGTEALGMRAKINVTMNLPMMALEFLKHFKGLINDVSLKEDFDCEIIIHVYCFTIGDNHSDIAKQMLNESMGVDMSPYINEIFCVRNVSPTKEMMRISLKMTKDIIFYNENPSEECNEPPSKIQCIRKMEE